MRHIRFALALVLLHPLGVAAQLLPRSFPPGPMPASHSDGDRRPKITTPHCLLLLPSLCSTMRDRPVMILAAGQLALSVTDSVETEVSVARLRREGRQFTEFDPLARPLVNHPLALYALDAGGAVATAWLAHKMRNSSHSWERRLWWLPQSLVIAGNVSGTVVTAVNSR